MAGFGGFVGRRKRFVQSSAFFIREIVAFIIGDEVNHGAFAQSCRLVEYDAAVRDARSEGAHVCNIRP